MIVKRPLVTLICSFIFGILLSARPKFFAVVLIFYVLFIAFLLTANRKRPDIIGKYVTEKAYPELLFVITGIPVAFVTGYLRCRYYKEMQFTETGFITTCREMFKTGLYNTFDDKTAGILEAMLIGNKKNLDPHSKDLYMRAGIGHILAISGTHIACICLGFSKILKILTFDKKLNCVLTSIFVIFYVVFSGCSTSSVRAGIMCICMLLGSVLRRKSDILSALSAAALIMLFINPSDLYGASFFLSFSAMIGVHYAKEMKAGRLLFGSIITVFTLPFTCWFFFEFSPYSIMCNLIVIPLAGIIIASGLIGGGLGMLQETIYVIIGKAFGGAAAVLLAFIEYLTEMTEKLPYSTVLVGKPGVIDIIVYYTVIIVLADKKKEKEIKRLAFAAGFIFIAFARIKSTRLNEAALSFLDVGQGDCAVLKDKGKCVMFDGGSSTERNVSKYKIVPYLKENGIMLIDVVTVSHKDNDHISGIKEILENMDYYTSDAKYRKNYNGNVAIKCLVLPGGLFYPDELANIAKEKGVEILCMDSGTSFDTKNTHITCISPDFAHDGMWTEDANEASLVFNVEMHDYNVFMMGDAGTSAELRIMNRGILTKVAGEDKTIILKAGHHGSKTASSDGFLDMLSPDIVIISCGKNNTYGHPHKEVRDRLEHAGVTVHRTDIDGIYTIFDS